MKKLIILTLFLIQTLALHAQDGSVVCLHGFFRSFKCMIPIANTLHNEGLNVYIWDYKSRYLKIEDHAENLVEILNTIAKERPGEPIHFVTHSLGGVIVRAAVNHPNCPHEAKIGRATLYAPPNQGAQLARRFQKSSVVRWIFGKGAGAQLLDYSQKEMASIGEFPSSMEVLVIAGTKGSRVFGELIHEPNDGKVTVDETYLNTPHYHKKLHVSHNWIMTSRQSLNITKNFILSHPPTHHTPYPAPVHHIP